MRLTRNGLLRLQVAIVNLALVVVAGAAAAPTPSAELTVEAADAHPEVCPRPLPGSVVPEPRDLRSENGVLQLDLTLRDERRGGSLQVLGGASGALIIEGLERANPAVAGLPERVNKRCPQPLSNS